MSANTTSANSILDHMVVNVQLDMDTAERQFAALGFTLTPRGFHSLGSINHLMMFATDYLELIGLPPGAESKRPELAGAPRGLNGLVFKTDDVNSTYEQLVSIDMAGARPHSFSRPVEVDGQSREACFSTVSVRAGVFPAGRVYFCQHHTPELVWRPEWQAHANGVQDTQAFVVVARDPHAQAERYARLLGRPIGGDERTLAIDLNGPQLLVLSQAAYAERFGAAAVALGTDDTARFGALTLRCTDLAATTARLRQAGEVAGVNAESARTVVRIGDFDTTLELVA